MTDIDIDNVAPVVHEQPPVEVPDTTEQVTLTQAQLDSLIRSKMGLAGRQAKEDAEKLRVENEQLKQVVSGKGSDEELERTKGLLAEERLRNQKVLDESIQRQKDLLISQEAAANNHVDLDTTLRLTRGNLRHDAATGGFTVLDDAGNPRLNANAEPMTVSEFFKDFSAKKLHLVRGSVLPGTGSSGSVGSTPPRDPYDPAKLWGPNAVPDASRILNEWSLRDKHAYSRARAIAKSKGWVL